MQNRLFQNTLTQLKKDVKRVVGVIDDTETVIACSDESRIGTVVDNIFTVFDNTGEIKRVGGYSYKRIETFNKNEYAVFCEGEDDISSNACSFLGIHFLTIKQYYDEMGLLVTAKGEYELADTTKNVFKALGLEELL